MCTLHIHDMWQEAAMDRRAALNQKYLALVFFFKDKLTGII